MNTSVVSSMALPACLPEALSLDTIAARAPAVFADDAHQRVSSKYAFIPTQRILQGFMDAGFVPVQAHQVTARRGNRMHAPHLVRLRRRFETVQLRDGVPEVVFLNSHDGSSAYQLRMGIFRFCCANGLIVSRGAFPSVCVTHRGEVMDEVIAGALQVAERFGELACQVERMEHRGLSIHEQLEFADRAMALRLGTTADAGMAPSRLLECRRREDAGDDLWSVFNRVQEALLRGGGSRRSVSGRLVRMRAITSVRRDLDLNGQLWDLAAQVLTA